MGYPDPIIPLSENACRDCPFPFNVSVSPGQSVRIPETIGLKIGSTMRLPYDAILNAEGRVPTSGWTNPALSQWHYIAPPEDGILDLDFTAVPPTGIVLQVESPIFAHAVVSRAGSADFWGPDKPLRGVRVHGTQGAKEFPMRLGTEQVPDIELGKH